jgi:hypothetical protein
MKVLRSQMLVKYSMCIQQEVEVMEGANRATFERTTVSEIEGDVIFTSKYGPLKLVRNTLLSTKQK